MVLLLHLGCSEFGLNRKEEDPVGTDSGTTVPVDTSGDSDAPTEDSDPTGGTTDTTPVECDGVSFPTSQWWGSQPFSTEADPVDAAGRPFYDPAYEMVGWSTVVLPERNTPVGYDKAFLTRFTLHSAPPDWHLDFDSDDGLWLWLDGDFLGHWGGDWQEEGCVNDAADCLISVDADPVDVTAWATPGEHVLAGRVSNATTASWFDVRMICLE